MNCRRDGQRDSGHRGRDRFYAPTVRNERHREEDVDRLRRFCASELSTRAILRSGDHMSPSAARVLADITPYQLFMLVLCVFALTRLARTR
jgi:hypothetical protein